MLTITTVNPRDPDVSLLIQALDEYSRALYPPESNHLDPVEELKKDHVTFLGAFIDGELCGCGAVKLMPGGYGEIKRVYVVPHVRRQGVARAIMRALEARLVAQGVLLARLETGIHQPAALALYTGLGYKERGPFGSYGPDPLSVFMEKRLNRGQIAV